MLGRAKRIVPDALRYHRYDMNLEMIQRTGMKRILILLLLALPLPAKGQSPEISRIDSLLRRSEYVQALRLVRTLADEAPHHSLMQEKAGDILSELGDARLAIDYYNRCSDHPLSMSIIRRKQATQYYRLGEYDRSLELIHSIFGQGDTLYVDLDLAAKVYDRVSRPDSAVYYRRKAVRMVPGNAANVLRLVANFQLLLEPDSVVSYTTDFLTRQDSLHKEIRQTRGIQYYNLQKIDDAQRDFVHLYERGDRQLNTLYYLGMCMGTKGENFKALKLLTQADSVAQSENPWIRLELAKANQAVGRHKEAIAYFESVEALLRPDSALMFQVHQGMAYSLLSAKEYDKSFRRWETISRLRPDYSQAFYAMGMISGIKKQRAKEKHYYEAFIRLIERDPKAQSDFARHIERVRARLAEIRDEEFMEQ